ncbi:MAG: trypsin-like peptidase domain-containing protein [Gemmataceae bacterium]
MSRFLPRLFLALCLLCGLNAAAAESPDIRALQAAVQQSIEKAEPAIAGISVSRSETPQSLQELASAPEYFGSGVVLDHRLVLTCYHVVRNATGIAVRLPGREGRPTQLSHASIYAADGRTDLAVLRIDNPRINTPTIQLGHGEELKKGSFVSVLTLPLGQEQRPAQVSAANGIVSSFQRRSPGDPQEDERLKTRKYFGMLMQTDSRSIRAGSGGAWIDLDGKLVGLGTTQAALNGDAGDYAVVLDSGIRRVIEVLRRGEEVEYGFLGVARRGTSFDQRMSSVWLSDVTPNSPASRAGLNEGDVILRVDGQPVNDFEEMVVRIGLSLAGRSVVLDVQRPHTATVERVPVKLAKAYYREFGIATNKLPAIHGLRVDYVSVLANQGSVGYGQPLPDGVVVREVEKESPAEKAGLREYIDIVATVNGVRVPEPADFYREANKALKAGQSVKLTLSNRKDVVTLP